MLDSDDPRLRAMAKLQQRALRRHMDELLERYPRRARRLPAAARRVAAPLRRRATRTIFGRGSDTESDGAWIEVEHYHPERAHYQPSGWTWLRRALGRRGVGPGEVFADLGSGKGRVVLQAARTYPFERVIGVEISEPLTAIARENLERERESLRCRNVELVTADAVDWQVPDDLTIAYFYYPFTGAVFERVVAGLVDSLERAPRRMRIVYACPALPEAIEASGRFRLMRTRRMGLSSHVTRRVSVYESVDPAPTPRG